MIARPPLDMGKSKAFSLVEKEPSNEDAMREKLQSRVDQEPPPDKTLWKTEHFWNGDGEHKKMTVILWYYAQA